MAWQILNGHEFFASPIKGWSLFPLPLNLGGLGPAEYHRVMGNCQAWASRALQVHPHVLAALRP